MTPACRHSPPDARGGAGRWGNSAANFLSDIETNFPLDRMNTYRHLPFAACAPARFMNVHGARPIDRPVLPRAACGAGPNGQCTGVSVRTLDVCIFGRSCRGRPKWACSGCRLQPANGPARPCRRSRVALRQTAPARLARCFSLHVVGTLRGAQLKTVLLCAASDRSRHFTGLLHGSGTVAVPAPERVGIVAVRRHSLRRTAEFRRLLSKSQYASLPPCIGLCIGPCRRHLGSAATGLFTANGFGGTKPINPKISKPATF
jgi:hypothetical protein